MPEEGKELPEGVEAQNGLTSAMRNARKRKFRHPRLVDPKVIRETEETLLKISGVSNFHSVFPNLSLQAGYQNLIVETSTLKRNVLLSKEKCSLAFPLDPSPLLSTTG